ncbi:hypothetical protein BJ944DRAFT_267589 [Cunninghamella echinulata]|nr:hypothetical protein BJ944DRAFT_267589 [Cunninghamella echinulata]
MGQILSNFRSGETSIPDLGFDIETSTPSAEDKALYDELFERLVSRTPTLLEQLKSYAPSDTFKAAIENATPENEEKAWQTVLPTVEMLRSFHQYASELQDGLPRLLSVLCKDSQHFDQHPGLTKLMADILDFTFDFDYWKMRTPTLLNDFAYYRRLLASGKFHPSPINYQQQQSNETNISDLRSAMQEDDHAHKITMFLAPPTPMLSVVISTITNYVNRNQLQSNVGDCLVGLWAACFHHLTNKKRANDNKEIISSLKAMVTSIILYDQIDPQGAYSKHSRINVKTSLKLIQNTPTTNEEIRSEDLLSALKYNSKHLKDDSTPKSVKAILA